jgi:hypothetical protein
MVITARSAETVNTVASESLIHDIDGESLPTKDTLTAFIMAYKNGFYVVADEARTNQAV